MDAVFFERTVYEWTETGRSADEATHNLQWKLLKSWTVMNIDIFVNQFSMLS